MLMASAYRPLVQCQPSITEVSEQLSQFSVINGRPRRAAEFGRRFCSGELHNFKKSNQKRIYIAPCIPRIQRRLADGLSEVGAMIQISF